MDLPQGNKPYEWVKAQLLARADSHVQHRVSQFDNRVEFLNGVRWLLTWLDRNDLLEPLGEGLKAEVKRSRTP